MILILIFLLLLPLNNVYAADTHTADDCSYQKVKDAIDASQSDDTVVIPYGASCDWSCSPDVSGSCSDSSGVINITNKSITLQGGSPKPTINKGKIDISGSSSYTVTVKGFNMSGPGGVGWVGTGKNPLVQLRGGLTFRVTDMTFLHSSGYSLIALENSKGVIDNCTFGPNTSGYSVIYVEGDSDDAAFLRDSAIGTIDQVVVENCSFTYGNDTGKTMAIWGQKGSVFTFRYNTVNGYKLDLHGNCSGQGGREFAVYNNTWTNQPDHPNVNDWIDIRGGTGVVYKNKIIPVSITGEGWHPYNQIKIWLQEVVQSNDRPEPICGCCCDYPCEYQIGRGKDDLLDAVHFWDNIYMENGTTPVSANTSSVLAFNPTVYYCEDTEYCNKNLNYPTAYLEEDRDYVLSKGKPTYHAYHCPHPLTGLSGHCDPTWQGTYTGHLQSTLSIGAGGSATTGTGGTITW